MIDLGYVHCMARYNRWQNENLYGAADTLSDAERRRDRGAFFGDPRHPQPPALGRSHLDEPPCRHAPPRRRNSRIRIAPGDWDELKRERKAFDAVVIDWADRLDAASLAGELAYYSGAIKRELRKPKWLLVTHMFNHQTHHRGQVHCMLTQAGGKPGDTDLPFMPM